MSPLINDMKTLSFIIILACLFSSCSDAPDVSDTDWRAQSVIQSGRFGAFKKDTPQFKAIRERHEVARWGEVKEDSAYSTEVVHNGSCVVAGLKSLGALVPVSQASWPSALKLSPTINLDDLTPHHTPHNFEIDMETLGLPFDTRFSSEFFRDREQSYFHIWLATRDVPYGTACETIRKRDTPSTYADEKHGGFVDYHETEDSQMCLLSRYNEHRIDQSDSTCAPIRNTSSGLLSLYSSVNKHGLYDRGMFQDIALAYGVIDFSFAEESLVVAFSVCSQDKAEVALDLISERVYAACKE